MPVYKFTDGRSGWYFQFYFNKKKIKKEKWKGKHMNSKAEALKCEFECRKELAENAGSLDDKMLYDLYEEFIATTKNNLKVSTSANYDKFRRLYLTKIPNKSIYKLTPDDFVKWRNEIAQIDTKANYKNRLIHIMRACLNYGSIMYNLPGKLQYGLFKKINDYSVVEIDKEKNEFIPPEDFQKLCEPLLNVEYPEYQKDYFYYYAVLNVLYYTGLRIGELAALTLDDIKDDYLIVNKNYIRVKGVDYIQSPKNANSVRKVVLDQQTKELIKKYISIYKPKNVLFKLNGSYLNQQGLRRVLKTLAKETNLDEKYDLHPHALRHSHSSNLRKLGFDEFVISKRLGNTPQVSASTYIHSELSEQYDVVKKIR